MLPARPGQTSWYMPVIPVLERQENSRESKASLGYIASFRLALATQKNPISKKKKNYIKYYHFLLFIPHPTPCFDLLLFSSQLWKYYELFDGELSKER